jgi:hypothetical protein
MKYRRLALLVLASACLVLRAQDDEEQSKRPPTEIPDFSNLDEYIYEPRSAVQLSFRHLGGAKTSFFGTGKILAPEAALPGAGPNQQRVYHDGEVDPDQRTAPRTDSAGNPVLDPVNGTAILEPIPPDGRTNSWSYKDERQVNNSGENPSVPLGYIAFHSYSADVFADSPLNQKAKSTNGMDLAVTRDIRKFLNGRIALNLVAGMSVNDIDSKAEGPMLANVHTITDYYSTFGQVIPPPPYTAPTTSSQTLTDASGNTITVPVDTSILIGNDPAYRDPTTQSRVPNAVINTWKLKGAYYTFRLGPVLSIPIGSKFHVDLSAGPILVYAGTTYRVTQTFKPQDIDAFGDEITEADSRAAYKFRVGAYADASLAYDVTDKAGFFAGAVWQTAKSYTQELHTSTAQYSAKVDLANQNGLRAGMSVRF